MPGNKLFSWRGGVGALPAALTGRLGPALRTSVAVRRVTRHGGAFRIDSGGAGVLDAAAVVIATQAHVAARLVETVDACAAEAAGAIESPPQAVIFLGYEQGRLGHPLDAMGYLSAKAEGRPLAGALFCSTMFADRAPAGHVALAGYVGGRAIANWRLGRRPRWWPWRSPSFAIFSASPAIRWWRGSGNGRAGYPSTVLVTGCGGPRCAPSRRARRASSSPGITLPVPRWPSASPRPARPRTGWIGT